MSRDLVRACAIGRAATLRRGPGPAGVRADGPLFAGWLGHADVGSGDVRRACAYVPGQCVRGRPAATSVSRPASAHGLRKAGQEVRSWPDLAGEPAARDRAVHRMQTFIATREGGSTST